MDARQGKASETELLERDEARAAVARALEAAEGGRGEALFIVGEAGLGKTSVLERAREQAGEAMPVAFARGEEMERAVPFGLFLQAADALGPDFPDLTGGVPAVEPAAPFHRVLRWLERRAPEPMLLAIDDLHWADPDSLGLLAFLARRLEPLPIAMIAALRPWPGDALEVSRELVGTGSATTQQLAPLSRGSVAALLAGRTESPPAEGDEERAWELSGGNPLLVEQLGLALERGEHLPEVGEGSADLAENLLLARFAGLDKASMECARAASAFGTSFRPELAAEVAGLRGAEVDAALEALARTGLVAEQPGGETRFTHPLFAQALYADLPAPRRRRLHARCFELLADRGLEEEACEQAIRARPTGDDRAVAILTRSGQAALAAGAVASAAGKLEAAVELSGDRPGPELLRSVAQALSASGRMEESASVCRGLLAERDLDWLKRIDVLRLLGQAEYLTGAAGYGERALQEAAELGLQHGPAAAVQPLLDQSLSAWLADGPARALPLAARARELAADAEDPELRERADAAWGHLALMSGDPEGVEGTAQVARRFPDAGADLDPAELIWPWASAYQYGMNENYLESFDSARRVFEQIGGVLERAGAVNAIGTATIHLGNVANRSGRPREAMEQGIHAEEFSELTPGVFPFAQLVQAEAAVWLGRLGESEEHCRRAEEAAPGNWFAALWAAHVRGLRLLWEGDEAASDVLLAAERIARDAGMVNPSHMHWAGHAVEAHLAVDREAEALRVIEWLEGEARSVPGSWTPFAAEIGRARLAARAGDADAADEGFRSALARLEGTELHLQLVEGLLAHGGFLRRHGRQVEARPHLAEALRIAEAREAGWLAGTAHEELRLAGGRRRRGVADRDLLTAAERRVAEQAKAGHSNAEIGRQLHLSVNTVETHLKRVYSKLEIGSRRQLAAIDLDRHSA